MNTNISIKQGESVRIMVTLDSEPEVGTLYLGIYAVDSSTRRTLISTKDRLEPVGALQWEAALLPADTKKMKAGRYSLQMLWQSADGNTVAISDSLTMYVEPSKIGMEVTL